MPRDELHCDVRATRGGIYGDATCGQPWYKRWRVLGNESGTEWTITRCQGAHSATIDRFAAKPDCPYTVLAVEVNPDA
jgi:hypothetical protein